jgi:tRNA-specific 2-thiouridylase
VGDGQYAEAVLALLPEAARPGPVLDASGKLVGKHKGLIHYTVGQRRGLGIATGEPAYVTRLDTSTNTLHIGPREAVMHRHVRVRDVRWLADVRTAPFRASAMLRSTMRPAPCVATPTHEGRMEIAFDEPQFGPAPGQAAVVFERERVICGGVIG